MRFAALDPSVLNHHTHSELLTFPDELRAILEDCLSEDASLPTLEKYLPQVRSIITRLLQGLRGKQNQFREIASNNRPKSGASGHSRTDSGSQPNRSSRTHSRHNTKSSVSSIDDGSSRRNTHASSRRKESGSYDAISNGTDTSPGSFSFPPNQSNPPNAFGRSSQPGDHRPPSTPMNESPLPATPPQYSQQPPEPEPDPEGTPIAHPRAPQVPSSVKRYSLVDKPMQPPAVVIDEPSPPSPSPEPDRGNSLSPPPELPAVDTFTGNPGAASSLAALKKSDVLERRASKRFSSYNISKMTGGSMRSDRSAPGAGHPNRRSLVAGGGGTLTQKELAVLTEADEEAEVPNPPVIPQPSPRRQRSISRTRGPPPGEVAEGAPPLPPLPRTASQPHTRTTGEPSNTISISAPEPAPAVSNSPHSITVFLQVGREVKKVTMDPGLSFPSLRMLFVDKFAYNPGQEVFPAIYIRDPSSGVQYELEDTDEVNDRCLLSLNIEREYLLTSPVFDSLMDLSL